MTLPLYTEHRLEDEMDTRWDNRAIGEARGKVTMETAGDKKEKETDYFTVAYIVRDNLTKRTRRPFRKSKVVLISLT